MKKLMLLVIAMAFPLLPANAIEPGVYYCVIERMVGIQPERTLGHNENQFSVPRFAGNIEPDPARFVLKISEVSEIAPLCAKLLEAGADQPLLWPLCDPSAKYKAELPGDIRLMHGMPDPLPLVSVNGEIFHGRFSMLDIWGDRFRMAGFGEPGNYLSEGTCQRFEQ